MTPIDGTPRTIGMVSAAGSRAARGVLADDAAGHTGFTGTSLWLEPRSGRVFVLLTNRVHPTVPSREFQDLRLEFHRRAARIGGAH
jgi:CubicO group peptidase (beta-lactamase class C family)